MPAEPDPLDVAARALRHRDRSRAQIDARLAEAGVGDESRADALETLERVGYVDDSRYAVSRAGELARRGQGDEAIRYDLAESGIEPEQVEAALAGLEPEALRARVIASRLGRTPKTAVHLARKGFSAEAIESAVGSQSAGD